MSEDGRFVRVAAGFRSTDVEQVAGRYHLYVALACPWANGTLTALKYKGLEHVVGLSVVHPTWRRTRPDDPNDAHCGWWFRTPGDPPVPNELGHGANDCDDSLIPDTVNGARTIRELYEKAGDTGGKYSTPVLWDSMLNTIVSNESMDILRIFDCKFQDLATHPERRLFPEDPASAAVAEALNEFIYPNVNNGVYRCGFAKKQLAYEEASSELFDSLDRLEALFEKSPNVPFLTGNDFTWIDLRLYMTLVRFDPVYVVYFKTSLKGIERDYPRLLAFVRRCYAFAEVQSTTNMKHIKMHYFTSHPALNTYGIIPSSNGPALG
jgi:putative glutathione S-transferase